MPGFSIPPRKILIIRSGGVGDLLLALPAMRMFRQAFPHAVLDLLGRPERLSLVAHDLKAKSLRSTDQAGMAYFYLEDVSLPSNLAAFFSAYETVLAFGKSGGEILAKNLKRAGVGRVIFIPSFPSKDLGVHVSDYLLASLRGRGIGGEKDSTPLQLPEEFHSVARDFWTRHGLKEGERILAIHPGSGSPAKNWAPRNFARVADWASERSRVLLISGPAQDGVEEVRRAIKKAKPILADQLPLGHLAGILKSCSAYVGNDSGITHLAAFLGIPTVAIFGPTDPAVWGPKQPKVWIFEAKDFYSSCPEDIDSEHSRPAMKNIEAETAIQILSPLLES